jgi:hypothetical protein
MFGGELDRGPRVGRAIVGDKDGHGVLLFASVIR